MAMSPDQFNQPTVYYIAGARVVSAMTNHFSGAVRSYTNGNPIIMLSVKGCQGTCTGILTGPSLDVSCTRHGINYDLGFDNLNSGTLLNSATLPYQQKGPRPQMISDVQRQPYPQGKLITTHCTLSSAQVNYPFTFLNGTTILNSTNSSVDETVNRTVSFLTIDREAPGLIRAPSLLGGIACAISELYASNIKLYYSGQLTIQGSRLVPYMYINSNDATLNSSNAKWNDPTPAVLSAIRELSFRAAIRFANGDERAQQTVKGTQRRTTAKYHLRAVYLRVPVAILVTRRRTL
ncbi:hypothetical protein FHETE_10736 [Fusarium heterosporum]|uniref:Uncharacterized protein n=1 Tax=Fusarium heterosporum TaxID=42747 RepID=A0A8H5SSN4_FUSHE|nr:hypothetical protein FHETE_10736 [Fusarium heterosporum]